MQEAKHTPGRWIAGETRQKNGRYISTIKSNGIEVADALTTTGSDKRRAETVANARLIAAAPELLSLLQESQVSIGDDWRFRRDAAIQKATGS